jgi:methylated-DNA-[protein]-cysteine S-methyltransferase
MVWGYLQKIPYGKVTTYGEIAAKVARDIGKEKMSAQAVGGAVSKNPISIIVPCHRVIGKNGDMVGFASGVEKKIKLLKIEQYLH